MAERGVKMENEENEAVNPKGEKKSSVRGFWSRSIECARIFGEHFYFYMRVKIARRVKTRRRRKRAADA